ncbi:MAG: ABC transporter ATP-binding protein [Acidimicrobiia bacterium]|nr:ABC transporter ATP-binding protein [Acidimicrobiia bacterium]
MTNPYLHATSLTKAYPGGRAVDDASFAVEEGRILALLGPSGCGKTTLLRLVAGLATADRGRITLAGEVLTGAGVHVPAERRRVGMVFQDWALFPHLTVIDNVGYGLGFGESASRRAREALDMVGLADLAGRYPQELSGGQAQRVAVARALAPRPRVLLLDEPFSNLDTEMRVALRAEVAALMREVGMTAVFVTHDQEEAFVVGDEVAVMRDGRIIQQGTPTEVYEQPVSPWLAGFVGEANLVAAEANGDTATTVFGEIRLHRAARGSCRVAVRPEHLLIGNGDDGTVTGVEFYGHDTSYAVELASGPVLVRAMAAPRFRIGDRISLTYSGPAAMPFAPAETVPA